MTPDPTDPMLCPGGPVQVAGREFLAAALTTDGELALWHHLRAVADRQAGPGGLFARMAPKLKWLRESGLEPEWRLATLETTRLAGSPGGGVTDEQVLEARFTPEGVAVELYHRTRQHHPDVPLDTLKAIVTEANAVEVFQAVDRAVRPKKAPAPSAPPSG